MANVLSLNGLYIDNDCLGEMTLIDVRPYNAYVNDKRTDIIVGYKYTVVLPTKDYSSLAVKIEGEPQMSIERGTHIPVTFDGLIVKLYYDKTRHGYQLTAKADRISEI